MSTNTAPDFDLEYTSAVSKEPTTAVTPAELPQKYRDKSVEEIARMHMEAERHLSRVGNELGEQRRLTDALLKLDKDNAKVPEKKPVTADELFQDPNKAIEQAIQSSETTKTVVSTQQRLNNLEMQIGQRDFESKFPTYREDAQNPSFQEWAQKNPARIQLLIAADKYDFNAANALWDMWNEHKELTGTSDKTAVEEDRSKRVKAAKTVKAAASEEGSGQGPVYSRSKLMELRLAAASGDMKAKRKLEDPDFQNALSRAYVEGRVK